jgi:tetratricopeptide (TPR) repeat protein
MRTLMSVLILAMVSSVAGYTVPTDLQQSQALQSMSVGDLEKAGDTSRAQKDYPQAIAYFNEAVRKDGKNAKLYNKLGLAELSNGNVAAARISFTKATKYNKKYPEAWNDLGVVSYIDKNYEGAAKYFTKAINLDPARANFHVNLGITRFSQNQMDLAMQEYTRALQLDPEALLRSSNSGMSAQIADRDQQAKHEFMLARIYAQLGDVDNCLVCLEKAKENGYSELDNVYKEDDFSRVRKDTRLASIVPPPAPK